MQLDVPWMIYHSHPVNGHAFLRGSQQPNDLPAEVRRDLEDFSDRTPNYGDGHREWAPYPSGRPLEPWYVVTWTRRDEEAKRRGSIITQVLLLPRDVFVQSADLAGALMAAQGMLPTEGHLRLTLNGYRPVGDAGQALLMAFVQHPAKPVAVIGENLWMPALTGLWASLWPTARGQLTFRAFEAPHQVIGDPDVLLVPSPGQAWSLPAWRGGLLRALTESSAPLALEHLPQTISVEHITATVREARQLNALAAALRDERSGTEAAVHALAQLSHAPVQLSTREALATHVTQQLSGRLAELPGRSMALLSTVPDAWSGELRGPVTTWFRNALVAHPQEACEVVRTRPLPSWMETAFQNALRALIPERREALTFWSWWREPEVQELTMPALGREWDNPLVQAIPADGADLVDRDRVLERPWPRLYGTLTARAGMLNDLLALPAALRRPALSGARAALPDPKFVLWAVEQTDDAVLDEAALALESHPLLLTSADLNHGSWLTVWTRALSGMGAPDPGNRLAEILDLVRQGRAVPVPLLEALAANGQGQLLAHPHRDVLLPLLPAPYMEQTADAFLQSADDPGPVSPLLLQTIRARSLRVKPSAAASRRLITFSGAGTPLPYVEQQVAQTLTESDGRYLESLPIALLSRILRLAPASVQWHFRHHLKPIEVALLARRLRYQLDEQTWWDAFTEVVMTVGVKARSVWDELRWSTLDLPRLGTEREAWIAAINELSLGSSKQVDDVLSTLERRRPDRSDELRALRATCPETISRR